MAAAANPGDGAAWRYGRPAVGSRPKTGSDGTGSFWRYGHPVRLFASAPSGTLEAIAGLIAATSSVSVALTVLKRLAALSAGSSTVAAALTVTHTSTSRIDGSKTWRYGRPTGFLAR